MKDIPLGTQDEWKIIESLFGGEDNPFSLPRRWDGKAFYEDLDYSLRHYKKRVSELSIDKELSNEVANVCSNVLNVVRTYFHGYPAEAYEKFTLLMDILKNQPLYADPYSIGDLYRMTKVEDNINDRTRIFHAPYTARTKVATYRYSIAGHPCLYLADSLLLADIEANLFASKEKAIAARFHLCVEQKYKHDNGIDPRDIHIIEMGFRPQDIAHLEEERQQSNDKNSRRDRHAFYNSIRFSDENVRNENLTGRQRYSAAARYVLWFPLIFSCSYVRTNRSNPFASEYTVPQMLTQWLRHNNTGRLIGIRYFSCFSKAASKLGANLVFPSSGEPIILNDGVRQYCPLLNEAFMMTETEFIPEHQSLDQLSCVLSKKTLKHAFRFSRNDFIGEKKVQIPSGEMYIPARLFFNCQSLETVLWTNAIVGIGDRAFHGCRNLTFFCTENGKENEFPAQLETIGDGAFAECINLKTIVLPEGLKHIGTWALYECKELEELTIPSSVSSIGRGLVSGCAKMHKLEVNENNPSFYSTSDIIIRKATNAIVTAICNHEEFSTPEGIAEIEDGAFSRCTRIKALTIGQGIKKIGEWAFEYCRNIECITFPSSIETIGSWAFQDCSKIKEVVLCGGLKSIGIEAFAGCESLEVIRIPASIETLSYGILCNCTTLKQIIYDGTRKSWIEIVKDDGWDFGIPDYMLLFSDGSSMSKEELHHEYAGLSTSIKEQ